MNERQTLKQYSTYDNKITLQNVLDIIASYGGLKKQTEEDQATIVLVLNIY